jgi:hypothetical protein
MRTTLDLDPKLLELIEQMTGEASPSKAVNKAMAEFVRKERLAKLRTSLISGDLIGSLNDTWREDEERELEDARRHLQ